MNEIEYKKFKERYDQFKNNNLPTPFWDEERLVQEYVYFYNDDSKEKLKVYENLIDALGDIAFTGFYYSFTDRHLVIKKENGKTIKEFVTKHNHTHSFESVVNALYLSPESFSISKEEEHFFSKQELEYLRRIQKYLLFIGMKDIKTTKKSMNRYQNKKHNKYGNAVIYKFNDTILEKIMNGERDFRVINWYPEYTGPKVYKKGEYQALIVDKEDNFKLFVEFTNTEIKFYKDIKNLCIQSNDLKDDDKLIVMHFKILEVFK